MNALQNEWVAAALLKPELIGLSLKISKKTRKILGNLWNIYQKMFPKEQKVLILLTTIPRQISSFLSIYFVWISRLVKI